MFNKQFAIEEADKFFNECAKYNLNFSYAYLFGSTLTDSCTDESDIDILLVSDNFTNDKIENLKLLARANKKFYYIDAHPFSNDYFKKGDPFINEIKTKGYKLI